MPLMMPLASCDANNSTNGITGPKSQMHLTLIIWTSENVMASLALLSASCDSNDGANGIT